jgi:hypothetical protein
MHELVAIACENRFDLFLGEAGIHLDAFDRSIVPVRVRKALKYVSLLGRFNYAFPVWFHGTVAQDLSTHAADKTPEVLIQIDLELVVTTH